MRASDTKSESDRAAARGAWTPYRPRFLAAFRRGIRRSILLEAEAAKRLGGDYVEIRIAGALRLYLVSHPAGVEHVLVTNHRNYIHGEPEWTYARRALGDGLVTSDGELHRRQRHLVQPAFHRKRIAQYARIVGQVTERVEREWRAREGDVVDVNAQMMRLTMLAIARVLFGMDLSSEAERVAEAVTAVNTAATTVDLSLMGYLAFLPVETNRRVKRAVRYLDELIGGLVAARRVERGDHEDVLSMLLAADRGSALPA